MEKPDKRQAEGEPTAGAGCFLAILTLSGSIAFLLLHLFTTASFWQSLGPIAGVIAFFLPGIAEVALLFMAASVNPLGWNNAFTYYFAICLSIFLLRVACLALLPRAASQAEPPVDGPPEASVTMAAHLAIGEMSTGNLDRAYLASSIRSAYPGLSDIVAFRSIAIAARSMMGQGIPEQFEDPGAHITKAPYSDDAELMRAKTELEGLKADAALMTLRFYRERVREGRFFHPVEATMTPLEAAAVVYRFSVTLDTCPRACPPYMRISDLSDSKTTIINALMILYIHRWRDLEDRENLTKAVFHINFFVADELIDACLQEAGSLHLITSDTYGRLTEDDPIVWAKAHSDWKNFTTDIDAQMRKVSASEVSGE